MLLPRRCFEVDDVLLVRLHLGIGELKGDPKGLGRLQLAVREKRVVEVLLLLARLELGGTIRADRKDAIPELDESGIGLVQLN